MTPIELARQIKALQRLEKACVARHERWKESSQILEKWSEEQLTKAAEISKQINELKKNIINAAEATRLSNESKSKSIPKR